MNQVIKPPKKRPNFQIELRRAPTQEDFFRGALPKNPIWYSDLPNSTSENGAGHTTNLDGGGSEENTRARMSDIRLQIARDLDMHDAEELIELIVCNQIIAPSKQAVCMSVASFNTSRTSKKIT